MRDTDDEDGEVRKLQMAFLTLIPGTMWCWFLK